VYLIASLALEVMFQSTILADIGNMPYAAYAILTPRVFERFRQQFEPCAISFNSSHESTVDAGRVHFAATPLGPGFV
jgi:hypothetical protein